MNFSPPHSAAVHDNTMNTADHNPADTSSFFDVEDTEHRRIHAFAIWKEKAGRIYASIVRPRPGKRGPVVAAGSAGTSPSSSTPPTDSSNPASRPPRRRRYIDVWIPKDPPSSSSSSSGSRRGIKQAYRIAIKDRVVRKHLTICTVSCILLLSMIPLYSIYDSHSTTLKGQTYHVFFLLFLMVFVIIFCHSLARTCLLVTSIARHGGYSTGNNSSSTSFSSFRRIPSVAGPQGYAQPAHPIQVVLARDEEIALEASAPEGEGSTTSKLAVPPPAYGLWRNTVRINPNLLYWQRVDNTNSNTNTTITRQHDSNNNDASQNGHSNHSQQQQQQQTTDIDTGTNTPSNMTESTQNRPPSYVSEDGVEYVVQVQPRSTVSHSRVSFSRCI